MHSFIHHRLPLSFDRMWIPKKENAFSIVNYVMLTNCLYYPIIMQLYSEFHCLISLQYGLWNAEGHDKFNPIPHRCLKNLKKILLL
jgi:hypothetical protein